MTIRQRFEWLHMSGSYFNLDRQQKRLIWHIRRKGARSRSQIAHDLEISNSAVTRLSRDLIALNYLEERESTERARNRPNVPLALSGRGGYAAGAALHPRWFEIVLVDFTGRTIVHEKAPADDPSPRAFVDRIEERLHRLIKREGLLYNRFIGFGIAVPGYVTAADPALRWTVEWLQSWREIRLDAFFADALGLPVWVENDATAAALAEYHDCGLIDRHGSALIFYLGHGVGAGVVCSHRICAGDNLNAGEIGRLFLNPDERPSGIDLLRTLRAKGVKVGSLADLEALIDVHRPIFESWMDRAAEQLSLALLSGIAWIDPGAVVFSGSLPPTILQGLADRLSGWDREPHRSRPPELIVSRLGGRAVPIGSALTPIHAILPRE